MKKYALRKIGKKLLPVAFGISIVSIAELTGEVSAKENLTLVRAVGIEEKVTKEQVEIAKSNLDNTISEVKYQEESFSKVKKEVEFTKELVDLKNNEIKDLEEISKKSTIENISKAKSNILKEENNVKTLEEKLSNLTSSKEEVSNQTRVIEEKQKEVATAEKDVSKSEQDYNTAKATLEGTNAETVTKALAEAKATEEQSGKELEATKTDLEEAKKIDLERSENIKKSTSEKNVLTTEVSTAKTNLTSVENKVQDTTTALNTASIELEKAKADVESFNTIKLTNEYISNLKKAFDFNSLSEERELSRTKLKEINSEVLSLNKYKVNSNDDNVTKLDVNNLDEKTRKELSLFASELVNQIRTQMGTKSTTVTNSSIVFANKVANGYKKDSWSIWQGKGHDEVAISNVAKEYGLPEGQFYENLAGITLYNKQLTYSQLKQGVYEAVVGFMLNGREWLHAQSVAGLNWGDMEEEYLGLDFSNIDRTQVHLLTISKDKVTNATKQNFSNVIANPITLEKLQAVLNIANTTYNQKLSEDKVAQQNLLNAKSVYEAKSSELTTISEKLNSLLAKKELVPEAEAKVKTLTTALETAKQDLVKAQENYDNLSADIKIKQQAVDNAKKVLDEKLDNLQTARSVLNIEQVKLSELNNKLTEQEAKVVSIKNELEQAKTKIQTAKDYLYKLENTPELLRVAKEQLTKLEQELSNKEDLLKEEITKLEKLKITQSELENIYLESLKKYNKRLEDYKLQELQKQLDKIEKEKSTEQVTEYKENLVKNNISIKENNPTKKLLNTGSETTSTAILGILILIAGLFGLRRKQK